MPTIAISSPSISAVMPSLFAAGAAIAGADREVDQLLGQRVERARRHHLLEAQPGAPQSRRVVCQRLPEIVDPVGAAGRHDVVIDGADLGVRFIILDQPHHRHFALLATAPGGATPALLSSTPSRPDRKRPSIRKSLTSDQPGWPKVSGR